MPEEKTDKNSNILQSASNDDFQKLLSKNKLKIPKKGDIVSGTVIAASKAEVKIDIGGILTGVVRGPELYEEDDDYANLRPGNKVEATVIDLENENGELELSFKSAGQERAWNDLRDALEHGKTIKVKATDANKGGIIVKYRQIFGFLPVSQLAPENYPRIGGGDRSKILEKLKSFVGKEFEVKLITLREKEDKIIFSEKEAWNEKQKDVISKYRVGSKIEGTITAITDFGVFVGFDEKLEGLIHISELAWQRIDNPADLYKVGDKIKAEIIGLEGPKIFLSAKKLIQDPWHNVKDKYKAGQVVCGTILKINPFGLFVRLDNDIHGLAHISQLGLASKQKINEKFKIKQKVNFEIVSIEPKEHRLGLVFVGETKKGEDKSKEKTDKKTSSPPKKSAGDKQINKKREKAGDKTKDIEDKKTKEKNTISEKPKKKEKEKTKKQSQK